ncbi:RTA1 like protein-domain-containing protein [Xylariales sp. PMI_506]|nr:RTA1 like protein-domain-containing protein [Xylariales sp. PMI_506]
MTAELLPYKGGYYLWKYLPSIPAAIVFAALFFVATAGHAWKLYRTRMWFSVPFVIGGIMEIIGYIARAMANGETDELGPYIMQSTLLLLPPVLFAASIYMVLARIIRAASGETYSLLPVRIITKTFVWSDVASFMVQGSGAGLMATGSSSSQTGQWIVVGGLLIQIFMFGFFIVVAITWHYRYETRSPQAVAQSKTTWKKVLWMIYCVSLLIMVRSVYRVCEFVLGNSGYLMTHEWSLYVFDSSMMFIVMAVYYLWYPDALRPFSPDVERVESVELFAQGRK